MKRIFLLLFALVAMTAAAAPIRFMPAMRVQPNGDTLRCFVSGDEFYNWLHDANNYTIVQNHKTGYWCYAMLDNGELVASDVVAGSADPHSMGFTPGLTISRRELELRHKSWEVPEEFLKAHPHKNASNFGVLNNIVVFVRFNGDPEISTPMSNIDHMYNDTAATAVSLYNFFLHASYNQLEIKTHFYPAPVNNHVISYEDIHPRGWYVPYDATTNPIGYQTENDRGQREFDMIQRAAEYVNEVCPIDSSINIDNDNDGDIDNISFVVKGTYTGWSDLLWPHKWNLYDRTVTMNGKRINTFNFVLEGAGDHYFGASTLCHEMFHALSAPDLYHYYDYTNIHPAGAWDLMEQNGNPPQHPSAYLKFKYGHWIDSIPTVSQQGTYSLRPLDDAANTQNCWKIPSADPNQFYVLEYRNNSHIFETAIPGTGLLIWRIDTRFNDGNASYNRARGIYDEVYLFRPDGCDTIDGRTNQAHFNPSFGRTEFTLSTNPHPFLSANIPDSTFEIRNILYFDDSMTFDYINLLGCRMPTNLQTREVLGDKATAAWVGFSDNYQIEMREIGDTTLLYSDTTSNLSYTFRNLIKSTEYEWRVKAICLADNTPQVFTQWKRFRTNSCYNASTVNIEQAGNEYQDPVLPLYTTKNYSYSQQIVLASEMNGPIEITKISFNYASSSALGEKSSCDIYLGHTSKTQFDSVEDMVPFSDLQLVYSGRFDCQRGWNDFLLSEAFAYNGNDNLVIAIDDNSNATSSNKKFYVVGTSNLMSLSYSSTLKNPNPATPNDYIGTKNRKNYRSMMRFGGCLEGSDDPRPENIQIGQDITSITTEGRTILVTTCSDQSVTLIDVLGRTLGRSAIGEHHSFLAPAPGVYLVKTLNGTAQKVIVK